MKHKKETMMKGIGLHVLVYVALGLFLSILGIPSIVVFLVMMTLFWGLVILSYAFWFHK